VDSLHRMGFSDFTPAGNIVTRWLTSTDTLSPEGLIHLHGKCLEISGVQNAVCSKTWISKCWRQYLQAIQEGTGTFKQHFAHYFI